MATRTAAKSTSDASGQITVQWGATGAFIGSSDSGDWVALPPNYVWVCQSGGTLGTGGSINLQGSLDGGTTAGTMKDRGGNALTFNAIGLMFVMDPAPAYVRPNATAGDGSTAMFIKLIGTPKRY